MLRRGKWIYFMTTITLSLALLSGTGLDADTSNLEKFPYLKSIAPTQEKYSHCHGEGIQTVINIAPDKSLRRKRVRRMEFAFSEGRGRSVESTIENLDSAPIGDVKAKKNPLNRQAVRLYNPEYSVLLVQPQSTSEFVIKSLDAGPEAGQRNYRFQHADPAHCITAAQMYSISGLFKRPNFRVDRVAAIEPKLGHRRVQVDFSYPIAPKPGNLDRYLASGSLMFFPDEGWIIDSYKLVDSTFSTPNKYITRFGQVSYIQAESHDLRPADSACVSFVGNLDVEPKPVEPGYEPIEIETFHFDKFVFGDLPAREFTLSAFGLPEYGAPANQRLNRPFPWWIVGTSVGAGGLAWALWRIGKRSRQPTGAA